MDIVKFLTSLTWVQTIFLILIVPPLIYYSVYFTWLSIQDIKKLKARIAKEKKENKEKTSTIENEKESFWKKTMSIINYILTIIISMVITLIVCLAVFLLFSDN